MTTATQGVPAHTGAPVVELAGPLVGGSHQRATAGTAGLDSSDLERSERIGQLRSGELGSVHSWELVTAVDGPGTLLTVFLSGCPLRCLYCHNPDTMQMRRGDPVTADELVAFCGERLSDYKVPRRVTFVEELPRNATGKVVKHELPGR